MRVNSNEHKMCVNNREVLTRDEKRTIFLVVSASKYYQVKVSVGLIQPSSMLMRQLLRSFHIEIRVAMSKF